MGAQDAIAAGCRDAGCLQEQSRFSESGSSRDGNCPARALCCRLQGGFQEFHFSSSADKRRFNQRRATVSRAKHEALRKFRILYRLYLTNIKQHTGSGLISISWVFLQEPQHNIAQGPGDSRVDRCQVRDRRCHMMKDKVAGIVRLKRYMPHQAFEQHNAQ